MTVQSEDKRVARNLIAYFIDGDKKELIRLEYRYAHDVGFDLYTQIQNKIYQFKEPKFFYILSDLLDQLPATSSLMIPHHIIAVDNEAKETAITLETRKHFGFDVVSDQLRKELEGKYRLKICAFCKYLLQEDYDAGTDGRHD